MIPDDDFMLVSTAAKCVEFLAINSDYASALGIYCKYDLVENDNGEIEFIWIPSRIGDSITENDPVKRLHFRLSRYLVPSFYSVHQTNILKTILRDSFKSVSSIRLGEIVYSANAIVEGKLKIIPHLYGCRLRRSEFMDSDWKRAHELGVKKSYIWGTWNDMLDSGNKKRFQEDYNGAIDNISDKVMEKTGCTKKEGNEVAKTALESYLTPIREKLSSGKLLGIGKTASRRETGIYQLKAFLENTLLQVKKRVRLIALKNDLTKSILKNRTARRLEIVRSDYIAKLDDEKFQFEDEVRKIEKIILSHP